jgi:hypothetical protein
MHMVQSWEQCGPFMEPCAMNGPVAKFNIFFLTVVYKLDPQNLVS